MQGTSLVGDTGYVRDWPSAFRDQRISVLQVEPIGADPLGDLRRLRTLMNSL
jgi:hypothetical protein